jgi:murein DD-endopeptidase MepM/ murein hydrolase activator NlpD
METEPGSFYSQLSQLHELSDKIKMFAGFDNKFSNYDNLGVGGSFARDIAMSMDDPAAFNQWIKDIDAEMNQLDYSAVDQVDEYQGLLETVKEIKRIQDATPSICPVEGGRISSNFGYRQSPFNKRREFHCGLDISSPRGTPVKASADGVVTYCGYKGDLGKTVVIDHGFGIVTHYGHLSEIKTKAGQQVKRGEFIGKVGNTGRSTGPHLHYEVRLNSNPINPQKYIPEYLASKDLSK